jgi:hypothetical protein
MTQDQQDAAWRSLPEDCKRQLRCDYATAESAHSLDPTNVRIETHKKFLDMYFGAHNLTVTEEEKPRFSKGDKVLYVGEKREFANSIWRIDGEVFYNDYYKCDMVSSLFDGDTHICNVPLSDLAPYTEEREQVDGRQEVVDMTLKTWLNSTPDWLAYRMELAKEVTPKVISALSDGGVSSDFCDNVIDKVATIVNGIVERLKGGEK